MGQAGKPTREETTELLRAASAGDHTSADRLMKQLYADFRALARQYLAQENPGHTLQPTALVNEVYLRLVDQDQVDWQGRSHFFALGAQAMRRVLVDHARRKGARKRGGELHRVPLDEEHVVSPERDADVLAVDEAIEELARLDPRQAKIVEMRFFGGMTMAEIAQSLGVSLRTVEGEWTMIRAWLRRRLSGDDSP